ncbi:MAG: DUF5106 domain-containing protein [Bacteroidales bacterium]|nr:DUF5106 domain-containing protein [Bacteroidales bacterium]
MNRVLKYFIFFLVLVFSGNYSLKADGYEVKICISHIRDTQLMLSHRMGNRFFVDDTIRIKPGECGVFKDINPLPQGMYQIVLPSKKYIEFFMDADQQFSIHTSADHLIDSISFDGSETNTIFQNWQKHLSHKQMDTIFWKETINRLGNGVAGKFVKGLYPVQIPVNLTQNEKYLYYRHHFFDNIDFADQRLLRTPLIRNKLNQYCAKVALPDPDSVINDLKKIIKQSEQNPDVYQYTVQFLFNYYAEPKIMGMDAVYVYLAEHYYLKGKTPWITSENLQTIIQRVNELKPLLIGQPAPELPGLINNRGESVRLDQFKGQLLILYFWEPDCGFCKEATPKLRSYYDELKQDGVEVLAVNTREDTLSWDSFIRDHHLNWINVYSPKKVIPLLENYQAWSTPTIYILNKQQKIIAKNLTVDQIVPFIQHYRKNH